MENIVKRRLLALIAPPVAVCRYGCAGCCAAPIGVFWIAGMVSIVYAFFGGPAEVEGFSSGTFLLGAILWLSPAHGQNSPLMASKQTINVIKMPARSVVSSNQNLMTVTH